MSEIEKRIGAKITQVRLEKKMTQPQVAKRINVSMETISRLERGVNIPSLKTIEKISVVLDVPIKTFFEFDEAKAKDSSFEREISKFVVYLKLRIKRKSA